VHMQRHAGSCGVVRLLWEMQQRSSRRANTDIGPVTDKAACVVMTQHTATLV
jgi:hypothetical protein